MTTRGCDSQGSKVVRLELCLLPGSRLKHLRGQFSLGVGDGQGKVRALAECEELLSHFNHKFSLFVISLLLFTNSRYIPRKKGRKVNLRVRRESFLISV